MAARQQRGLIVQDFVSPQFSNGSVYACIPKRVLKSAGLDPKNGDLPDEIEINYHKSGDRDGELVIDLGAVVDE